MKACSYCGRENDDKALTCFECGAESFVDQSRKERSAPEPEKKRPPFQTDPLTAYTRELAATTLSRAALRRCRCNGIMNACGIEQNFVGSLIPIGNSIHYRCQHCNYEVEVASIGAIVFFTLVGIMFSGMTAAGVQRNKWTAPEVTVVGIVLCGSIFSIYSVWAGVHRRRSHPVVSLKL